MNQLSRKNILSHSINIFIWSEKNSRRKIWKKCFFLEKKFCMFWKTFACWRCSIELSIKLYLPITFTFWLKTTFDKMIDRWQNFVVAKWRHLESCWLVPDRCVKAFLKRMQRCEERTETERESLCVKKTHRELIEITESVSYFPGFVAVWVYFSDSFVIHVPCPRFLSLSPELTTKFITGIHPNF